MREIDSLVGVLERPIYWKEVVSAVILMTLAAVAYRVLGVVAQAWAQRNRRKA